IQTMRDMHTQWVENQLATGRKITDIIRADGPGREMLAKLYPHTELATPEGFAQITSNELSREQILKSNPMVAEQYAQNLSASLQDLAVDSARKSLPQAYKDLRAMGPAGQRAIAEMDAARGDPIRQSEIASQAMFGMTPQQAVAEFAKLQKNPDV